MKSAPHFTMRQLSAFVTAAELGNFTQVARRLNLTASAISNQIAELEGLLGFQLFERTTRKVALTPEGREFLPAALAIRRQLEAAANIASDIRNRAVASLPTSLGIARQSKCASSTPGLNGFPTGSPTARQTWRWALTELPRPT